MNELLRIVTGPLPVSAVRGPVLAHEHLALDLTLGCRPCGDPDTGAPGRDHRGTGGAAP
ncbi:hypothetical protein BKA18_005238 [Streptomyces auratus]